MKLLSSSKINDLPHLDSRKLNSLQKGSGLFVVVEKKEEKGEKREREYISPCLLTSKRASCIGSEWQDKPE